jgi:hypothetical protein
MPSDSSADARSDVLRATAAARPESPARFTLRSLPFTFASLAGVALAVAILIAGLYVAEAALLPVVAGCSRPSEAWVIVARRFTPLLYTILAAVALVVVGLVCFVFPGAVLAFGFSLAAPVVLAEGSAGPSALQRSWDLMRRVWPRQLVIVVLAGIAVFAIRWLLGKYVPIHGLSGRILLNALVATLVLPFPIAASAMLYLAARRDVDGVDAEETCRSIRMLSTSV